jgi:hypothetical protein
MRSWFSKDVDVFMVAYSPCGLSFFHYGIFISIANWFPRQLER